MSLASFCPDANQEGAQAEETFLPIIGRRREEAKVERRGKKTNSGLHHRTTRLSTQESDDGLKRSESKRHDVGVRRRRRKSKGPR